MDDSGFNKPRKLWTKAEDTILLAEVTKQASNGILRDWLNIAAKIPGRSNKDCRKRWIKLDGNIKKGPWHEEEDQLLRKVLQQDFTSWNEVSHAVKTRSADQCAKRWHHFLNPNLDYSAWTEEDDQQLLAQVAKQGHNWKNIVGGYLKGRSATDAKNRYTILQRNRQDHSPPSCQVPRARRRRITAPPLPVDMAELQQPERQETDDLDWSTDSNYLLSPLSVSTIELGGSIGQPQQEDAGGFNFSSKPLSTAYNFPTPPQFDPNLTSLDGMQCIAIPNHYTPHSLSSVPSMNAVTSSALPGDICDPCNFAGEKSSTMCLHTQISTPETCVSGQECSENASSAYFQTSERDTSDVNDIGGNKYGDGQSDDDCAMSFTQSSKSCEPTAFSKSESKAEAKAQAPNDSNSVAKAGGRKKTIVLQHVEPHLVKSLLDVLFLSGSAVDVKILDQN